ncbi:c-type cytochrome [Halovulum sp. GXIMD14793]
MELTKIVAGFCGALLILMLLSWTANIIFGLGESHHGEGSHHAYIIEVPEEGEGGGEEVAETPFDITTLMASADAAAGEKVFKKCSACHKLEDGGKGTGPHLFGIVGRSQASIDGYGYSSALGGLEGTWTEQALSEFITNSTKYAPGTKMNVKVSKPEDRANLIAYLAQNQ